MLIDSLRSALKSIWANRLRSFLTILGVIIGIYAVVTLLAAAQGVQKQITSSVEDFGPKTIMILPGEEAENGTPNITANFAPSTLFVDDIIYLSQNAKLIDQPVDYATFIGGLVSKDTTKISGLPVGITPGAADLFSVVIKEGEGISQENVDKKEKVIVISKNAAEKLGATIGDELSIGANNFKLTGIFEIEQELNLTSSSGDMFLIPVTVANEINQSEQVNRVVVYAKDINKVDEAREEVKNLLTAKHGSTDFTVLKPTDLLETINQITDVLAYMVVGIASISLLVGGIGISNIMLVTVAERTREIGIRKAVGATEGAILLQFLIEAVLLTVIGSVIGLLMAYGTSLLAAKYSPLEPLITLQTIGIALSMGGIAGIVFGLFPAIRAARKNPVEALRFE
jgi:putative ABC transport system permease protein